MKISRPRFLVIVLVGTWSAAFLALRLWDRRELEAVVVGSTDRSAALASHASVEGFIVAGLWLLGSAGILFSYFWFLRLDQARQRTLGALRHAERRWQTALDSVGDGLWEWEVQTGAAYFSPRWKAMLGFADDEFPHQQAAWIDLIHPEDRAAVEAGLRDHAEGRTPRYESEHRLRGKDGGYRWVLSRGLVIARAEDGRALRAVGTHTDITARRQLGEELHETRERYRFFMQHANDPMVAYLLPDGSRATRIIEANEAACRLSGYSREELLTLSPLDLERAPGPAEVARRLEVLRQKQSLLFESEIIAADGHLIPVEVNAELFEFQGQPTVLANIRDFTARQQAEARRRKDAAQAAMLLELYPRALEMTEAQLHRHVVEIAVGITDSLVGALGRVSGTPASGPAFVARVTRSGAGPDPLDRASGWTQCSDSRLPVVEPGTAGSAVFVPVIEDARAGFVLGVGGRAAGYSADDVNRLQVVAAELQKVLARLANARALALSEERYRLLFDSASDALMVFPLHEPGRPGKFTEANVQASALTGHALGELRGMSLGDLEAPGAHPALAERLAELQRTGTVMFEAEIVTKAGTRVPVETHARVFGRNGVTHVLASLRDVSLRRRSAAEIARLSREREAILETVPIGICYLKDRKVQWANEHLAAALGYTQAELIGVDTASLYATKEGYRQVGEEGYQVIASGGSYVIETAFAHRDGSEVWGQMSGRAVNHRDLAEGTIWAVINLTDHRRAALALHRSETQLEAILASTSDGILAVEVSGTVLRANRRFLEMWEMPPALAAQSSDEPLLAHVLERLVRPDEFRRRVEEIGASRRDSSDEILARDGRAYEVNSAPLRSGENLLGRVWSFRDISDRKRAEQALLEGKRELDLFFNQSLDGYFFSMLDEPVVWSGAVDQEAVLDQVFARQRLARANDALLAQYGATREQLIGLPPGTLLAGDRASIRRLWRRLFDAGRLHEITEERKLDGTPIWIEGDYTCLRDAEGRILGHFGVQRDITDRKRAEAALRESEERFRVLFEQAGDHVMILDPTAPGGPIIVDANEAACRVHGYTREELIGQPVARLDYADHKQEVPARVARVMGGERVVFETVHQRKDGSLLPLEVCAKLVERAGRSPVVFSIERDITERRRVEAELRDSRENYRGLFDTVTEAIFVHDVDGVLLDVNAGAMRLYEQPREAIVGRPMGDLAAPNLNDLGVMAAQGQRVFATGRPESFEFWGRRHNGEAFLQACITHRGKFFGRDVLITTARDVTSMRRAEAELRKLSRAVEQSPVAVVITDTHGTIEYVNESFCTKSGYARAEVMGRNPRLLQSGRHPPDFFRDMWQVIASGREWHGELCNRRKDGTLFWEDTNISPVFNEAGVVTHYLGVKEDITSRRESVQRIEEQAALLNVTHDAIIVVGLDGAVRFWNRGAARLYGYSEAEVVGQPLLPLVFARETLPAANEAWQRIIDQGEWGGELTQRTEADAKIVVRVSGILMRDSTGAPHAVLITATDLTESKRLEAQYLRAQRMESLGSLASGVAHDLNNVLTPILVGMEVLRPLAVAQHDHEIIDLVCDCARRGADIVQQLLVFGRGSDTPRAIVDVAGVLEDLERMMRETFPKNLSLRMKAARPLWSIEANRTELHQVLLNLCVNARDAMPYGGELTVTAENVEVDEPFARLHAMARPGPHVVIRVIDTGTGIAADLREKIFDPFFTTKPQGQGTGLGLATVLGITQSLGGFVSVDSQEGHGSTFAVFVPAKITAGQTTAATADRHAIEGRGELVLLVDDEVAVRTTLQHALQNANYRVVMAANGAEALAVYAQNGSAVRLVITDIMMPVMDGAQLLHALRRLADRLPAIAMSGLRESRPELEKLFGKQLRFLGKPFLSEAVLRAARELIDETERPA